MPHELSNLLRQTIDRELPILQGLPDAQSTAKPAGVDSWSPREELGHLIDSVANNHIRFVRAGTEPDFLGPGYAQNAWVDIHGYQHMPWSSIVEFWYKYNSFLVDLVARIPAEKLATKCYIGN